MSSVTPVLHWMPEDPPAAEEPAGSSTEKAVTLPRWLVVACSGDRQCCYHLQPTSELPEARRARGEAQLLFDLLLPEQQWQVALYTLAEVS